MASAIRIGGKQASYDKRRTSLEGAEWQGYIPKGRNAYSGGIGNNHYADCKMRTKLTDEDRRKRKAECNRKYRQENKEKVAECYRKYSQENKDKAAERNRKYYQENKDKLAEYKRKYRQENKEKAAKHKRKYQQFIREQKRFAITLQMISAVGQITELQTT